MSQLARAVGLSRQSLYARFGNKEELFQRMVQHLLSSALVRAKARLSDSSTPLEARLVGAFDAWAGWYSDVGATEGMSELTALTHLVAPIVEEHEAAFRDALIKAIRSSGLVAAHKPSGLTATQLADALNAAARGHKYAGSRDAFVEGVRVAVRVMCTPLEK
jgi:AcrR family transcriptional regulator